MIHVQMAATKQRLYPSLDEVSGKRKHSTTGNGKENLPVTPAAKRPKFHGTPVRAQPNQTVIGLQSKIELEYKIRDGAAKLLQASKSTHQSMEASKSLFVSNAKIIAHMKEMQQRKEVVKSSCEKPSPCKAKIAISDIRIPLEWREFDHPKGKLADTHYGVFCLFKIGNQVMDSTTMAEVDKTTMDIIFRDTVIFPEMVGPDFALEVEVYCSIPVEESNKSSTPIKMLKKLRSKTQDKVEGSPALQSTVASSPYTPHGPTITPSHRFVLAGHAHLTIQDVSNSCRTYLLRRGSVGASGTASTGSESALLPLWGQICCTVMAEPACATRARRSGFVNLQRMVSGLPDWTRLWCVVRQHHLRYWASPEDIGKRDVIYHFNLTKTMIVEPAPRLSIRRPNALLLKDNSNEFFMAFESKEEREEWIKILRQAILDLSVWGSSCEFVIPVPQSKFYSESPVAEPVRWEADVQAASSGPGPKSETTL